MKKKSRAEAGNMWKRYLAWLSLSAVLMSSFRPAPVFASEAVDSLPAEEAGTTETETEVPAETPEPAVPEMTVVIVDAAGQGTTEAPEADPAAGMPVNEIPAEDTPADVMPAAEVPAVEAPGADAAAEAPAAEIPSADTAAEQAALSVSEAVVVETLPGISSEIMTMPGAGELAAPEQLEMTAVPAAEAPAETDAAEPASAAWAAEQLQNISIRTGLSMEQLKTLTPQQLAALIASIAANTERNRKPGSGSSSEKASEEALKDAQDSDSPDPVMDALTELLQISGNTEDGTFTYTVPDADEALGILEKTVWTPELAAAVTGIPLEEILAGSDADEDSAVYVLYDPETQQFNTAVMPKTELQQIIAEKEAKEEEESAKAEAEAAAAGKTAAVQRVPALMTAPAATEPEEDSDEAEEETENETEEETEGARGAEGTEGAEEDWPEDISEIGKPGQSETVHVNPGDKTIDGEEDWDIFCDEENGIYRLTYRINEDAEGDQTIDLTYAVNFLKQYQDESRRKYEEALDTAEAKARSMYEEQQDDFYDLFQQSLKDYFMQEYGLDEDYAAYYAERNMRSYRAAMERESTSEEERAGRMQDMVEFVTDQLIKTGQGGVAGDIDTQAAILQPGDTRKWEIYITSDSGHTYRYKSGSFTLTTPIIADADQEDPVKGFDSQTLSDYYMSSGKTDVGYNRYSVSFVNSIMEKYRNDPDAHIDVESMLETSVDVLQYRAQMWEFDQLQTEGRHPEEYYKSSTRAVIALGEIPEEILSARERYAIDALADHALTTGGPSPVMAAYLASMDLTNDEEGYKEYFRQYYSEKDGTEYKDFEDLVARSGIIRDLKRTYDYQVNNSLQITLPPASRYDNFYRNVLSFAYGDEQISKANTSDSWVLRGNDLTVADYMYGKVDKDAAWKTAEEFFRQLLADGLTKEEASWKVFRMMMNVDGMYAGNNYQDTVWGWYNSIQLDQIDGDLHLKKVGDDLVTEKEDGTLEYETIKTESEDKAAEFRLWYYEDSNNDGMFTEDDIKYFYTETVTADDSGNEIRTPGFVKYDPSREILAYTIHTSRNGELNIDRKMLEGIIYYLQETMAPDGYELDTTVYIICDTPEIAEEAKTMLKDADLEFTVSEGPQEFAYLGAIDSDTPLETEVVNRSIIEVKVDKDWADDDNRDGIRPDSVTFELLGDGEVIDTVTIGEEDKWSHVFTRLPKMKDGKQIEYTVTEKEIDGYTSSVNGSIEEGYVIVNEHKPFILDLGVSKVWEDDSDRDGIRPDTITVVLKADGEIIDSAVIGEAGDWSHVFGKLPKNKAGKEISYTIEEETISGYKVVINGSPSSGFTITNTHTPDVIDIKVTKVWDDVEDRDGLRPEMIEVTLSANGEKLKTIEVTKDMDWSYIFTQLFKNADGKPIDYTITEEEIEQYTASVTGSVKDGFVITNTHEPEDEPPTPPTPTPTPEPPAPEPPAPEPPVIVPEPPVPAAPEPPQGVLGAVREAGGSVLGAVRTGDSGQIFLWFSTALASAAGLAGFGLKRKKQRKKEEEEDHRIC